MSTVTFPPADEVDTVVRHDAPHVKVGLSHLRPALVFSDLANHLCAPQSELSRPENPDDPTPFSILGFEGQARPLLPPSKVEPINRLRWTEKPVLYVARSYLPHDDGFMINADVSFEPRDHRGEKPLTPQTQVFGLVGIWGRMTKNNACVYGVTIGTIPYEPNSVVVNSALQMLKGIGRHIAQGRSEGGVRSDYLPALLEQAQKLGDPTAQAELHSLRHWRTALPRNQLRLGERL